MRVTTLEAPKIKTVTVNGFSRRNASNKAFPYELTYARNAEIVDGCVLTRAGRMIVRELASADGIGADGELMWVEGAKLYYMGVCIDGLSLTEGKKDIYRIGDYVVIFPDGAYFNLMNTSDFGDISVSFIGSGSIDISTVDENKAPVTDFTVSYIEPLEREEGDLWAIPNAGVGYVMKKCVSGAWRDFKTYIKISARSIGTSFSVGDAVDCYGAESITGKAFKIADIEPNAVYCEGVAGNVSTVSYIKLSRKLPLLDHVAVCGDRLWGCRFGFDNDGNRVGRVYASASGNPLNWTARTNGIGVEKDIPSDGRFNGICKLGSYTAVFEDGAVTKLRITDDGVSTERYECEGVGDMAGASLAALGGEIYYKSKNSVCAYNGNRVKRISEALGRVLIPETGSYGGVVNGRYYVTMRLESGEDVVGIYDPESETWSMEDDPGVRGFAVRNGELYAICENSAGARLILWNSENVSLEDGGYCVENGYEEGGFEWCFDCGRIGGGSLRNLYPIKLTVRAKPILGELKISLSYDGEDTEEYTVCDTSDEIFNIPIKRKRADTVWLRFSGNGKAKVCGYELEYVSLSSKYQ